MKKKKIIFLVSNDLSYDQRMIRICTCLSSEGYDVELMGRNRRSSVSLEPKPYLQTRLNMVFEKGKLFYLVLNIRFFIALLFKKFDAVCAIDLDTIASGAVAAAIRRKPLIYDAHEYFTEVPEVIRRPTIQNVWKWVEKTFVPYSSLNYTVSESLAEIFSEKYQVAFHTIRNLPVPEHSKDKPAKRPGTILYQGALNEGRGLEFLIDAVKDMDAHLILAGDGDVSNELKKQVNDLKIEHKVSFTGYIVPSELKKFTATSYIGVNLLENKGLSYYYSLANKFSDYIHAGTPQVCIAFPEYQKLNNQYNVALLINNVSADEIKTALNRLLYDNNLYNTLQKNCEVCALELNWQEEQKKLISLYHDLLG